MFGFGLRLVKMMIADLDCRANLEDQHVRDGYQRGYKMIFDFFGKYI